MHARPPAPMAFTSSSKFKQCVSLPSLRSYLAEFISTFLYVFVVVGSAVSSRMLTPDVTSDASSLVAIGLAQTFGLFSAVYISGEVSGGHVNPAVTFALAVCGRVSVHVAIFYWIAQLVGSTFACILLRAASAGQAIPTTQIGPLMTGFGGAMVEVVITFALVLTVCVASGERRKGPSSAEVAGPLAAGLVAGACALAAGSLTGASMNPARSFGQAIVSGDFKDHGVYWAGPLIGAGLAALVHQNLLFSSAASLESGACDATDETSVA